VSLPHELLFVKKEVCYFGFRCCLGCSHMLQNILQHACDDMIYCICWKGCATKCEVFSPPNIFGPQIRGHANTTDAMSDWASRPRPSGSGRVVCITSPLYLGRIASLMCVPNRVGAINGTRRLQRQCQDWWASAGLLCLNQ
jgi:hypothetical protein